MYKAHASCQGLASRLDQSQKDLLYQRRLHENLLKEHEDLKQSHLLCIGREEGLSAKLAVAEKERDDLRAKGDDKDERIRQLEEALLKKDFELAESEKEAAGLRANVQNFAIRAGQEEILRFNYLKEFISAVVRRLHESDEYKKAWGEVFNTAIDSGWLEVIKIGRIPEQVDALLSSYADFYLHAVEGFTDAYDSMFSRTFPYVEKIRSSYYLALADLMNLLPDGTGATPGAGASGS